MTSKVKMVALAFAGFSNRATVWPKVVAGGNALSFHGSVLGTVVLSNNFTAIVVSSIGRRTVRTPDGDRTEWLLVGTYVDDLCILYSHDDDHSLQYTASLPLTFRNDGLWRMKVT